MNCVLYKNTGVNAVNIPDAPGKIASWGDTIETTAIDCLQNRFLSSISVKTAWSDIQDVDYANVAGFYYFVTGVTMTSYDVAMISLVPDFITSAGGPSSLSILDGVTERHHVAKSADTFGLYNEADALLSPAQPLNLYVDSGSFLGDPNGYTTVIESTIDLAKLGYSDLNNTLESRVYKTGTGTDGSDSVTVPYVPPVEKVTTFGMGASSQTTTTIGTCCFNPTNANVRQGIATARALGVEDAIVSQYALPTKYFAITYESDATYGNDAYISRIDDVNYTDAPESSEFNFEYATVRNKRVLYGDLNKYGILSVSGDSTEFDPEQIYTSASAPQVRYRADPRNNGKPYFNFTSVFGQSTAPGESAGAFFKNAVGGMDWRNVPLRYVDKSASVLDSYNLQSQRQSEISTLHKDMAQRTIDFGKTLTDTGFSIANRQAGMIGVDTVLNPGRAVQAGIGTARDITNAAFSIASQTANNIDYANQYRIAVDRELYNFGYSQSVVVPTVMFPFQTPSIRDYEGNGCFMYRYHPTDSDLARMDKLLTAYGYRHTAVLDTSMFSNRPSFNFVKASGVSVGGSLPNWWKSGIADQFSAGVRIWHVKPSPSYYTANE